MIFISLATEILRYDLSKMCKTYDQWPDLASDAFTSSQDDSVNFHDISHLVLAGMGGSGTIGDVLSSVLSKTNLHVTVVKGYLLPKTIDRNTLVLATSVSGNTVETNTVLRDAIESDCKIMAFSSGGKMQQICKQHDVVHHSIPMIHSPRSSFVTYLYRMLGILYPFLSIETSDILKSIDMLRSTQKNISTENLGDSNESLRLAKWMRGIPLIYYPWGLQAAAIRFKNSLQENAKIHAFAEDVIEASHNSIVSWCSSSNVQPVLIEGRDDYVKTKERWEIIKEFFCQKNIDYWEVSSCSGHILTKIVNLIYLLDYASIYRALLSKINPSKVSPIDFIKSHLE